MLHFLRPLVLSLAQISVAQVSLAKEPVSEARESQPAGGSTAKKDDGLPGTTPYDAKPKERSRYLHGYRDGRDWALHPDRHDHATTNPNAWNGAAIRGFVEGWKAGVRSAPAGTPTGDLPSKYARFITWNQTEADAFVAEQKPPAPEPDWNAIRAAWSKAHHRGPAQPDWDQIRTARIEAQNRKPAQPDWDQIRTARIKAHDRGSATEFTGRWKLTLPQGATYTVELSRGDDPEGLLQMKSDRGLVLLGDYSLKGDRLQLVAPKDGESAQDFDWQYRDGVFVLESHAVRNGGHYIGATLERMKGSVAP